MNINNVFLKNVDSYNDFQTQNEWQVQEGQPNDLYFRLIDKDRDSLRYIPDALATITVEFPSIDQLTTISKTASMVYSGEDRSIWKISLTDAEIPISGGVKFSMTEPSGNKKWRAEGGVKTKMLNVGGC